MTAGLPVRPTYVRRSAARNALLSSAILAGVVALSACGGGGDGETASTDSSSGSSSGTTTNHAPTIAGLSTDSVMAGVLYSFMPSAADADGDVLTFSISGKPSWATFDKSTGRLQGTPSTANIGESSNVAISVTDGEATAALATFKITVVGTATGSVTLSWSPPTANDDGSPLMDLVGYKVYWGTAPGVYPNSITLNNPGLSAYVVEQLTPATWYFVATAINSEGVESDFSNVATKIVM